MLLFQLDDYIWRFEQLKSRYAQDEDLRELYSNYQRHLKGDFLVQEAHLFKDTHLCIPKCGTHELLIREIHGDSLARNYSENNPLNM